MLTDGGSMPSKVGSTGLERANFAPLPRPAQRLVPAESENPAQLYVGPGITLKGEIFGCDTLRVEGAIDGSATARQLILGHGSSFLGTAEVDEAEIEGTFNGTLTVQGVLVLRGTGRIEGTLGYGQIEIERGGVIAAQITPNDRSTASLSRSDADFASSSDRRALRAGPKSPS